MAQCHIQLAQTLREEARKMEEFREKQKLQQKKVGFAYILRCCFTSGRKLQACLFTKPLDLLLPSCSHALLLTYEIICWGTMWGLNLDGYASACICTPDQFFFNSCRIQGSSLPSSSFHICCYHSNYD